MLDLVKYSEAYNTPAMLAYRATREFMRYLESKALWETAHAKYGEHANPKTANDLTITYWRMSKDLEAARKTDEHIAAFGW